MRAPVAPYRHESRQVITTAKSPQAESSCSCTAANIHLVGYFPFSEGTGETTIDQSASKLVGTIHAGSWVTTYTPYDKLSEIKDKIDRAIRLDGAVKGCSALSIARIIITFCCFRIESLALCCAQLHTRWHCLTATGRGTWLREWGSRNRGVRRAN
eukprot:SAG31_NODE_2021_length_6647_cov_2.271839_9_plen_156_part_00